MTTSEAATALGGAAILVTWIYQVGRSSAVLDRLAKAVDNLAAAHTTTESTVAGHAVRLDSHEKRLDTHDDQLREMR